MKKYIIIIMFLFLILNKVYYSKQQLPTTDINFTFPIEYSNEYKQVDGTNFNTKTNIIHEDRLYIYLTYIKKSDLIEEIQFHNTEKNNQDTLVSYLVNSFLSETSSGQNLKLENKSNYVDQLKSDGFNQIKADDREIWVQEMTSNLQGYESYGWIHNNNTQTILPVVWTLTDEKNITPNVDQNYAQIQYDKFIEIIKSVKF